MTEQRLTAEEARQAHIDEVVKANVATWPDLTPERGEQLRRIMAPMFARQAAKARKPKSA